MNISIFQIERVYMETPGGTRILQKDNVTTNLGTLHSH